MCSAKCLALFAIVKLRTIQTSVMDSQKSKAREPSLHDTWKVEHPAERASAEHARELVSHMPCPLFTHRVGTCGINQ